MMPVALFATSACYTERMNALLEQVDNVAVAASTLLHQVASASIAARGRAVIVLSGGSTPLAMYRHIVANYAQADFWQHCLFFWGDERFVPLLHPDSNAGAAIKALLEPLHIHNYQPWPHDGLSPEQAADNYAQIVLETLQCSPDDHEATLFDLVFLGLGDDAHTASLFPDTDAVLASGFSTVVRPAGKGTRLSLTAHTLSRAREVAFLVSGENKREALHATLQEARDITRYPAQAISARERTRYLSDIAL